MIFVSLHFNDTLKGRAATARDMNRLEEWASSNVIKFNKDKCNVWQTGWTKLQQGMLETDSLDNSSA